MINWFVTSSVLIAIVLLLRLLLKGRVSQRLQYALWLPVLLRLLIPFSFGSSEMSVLNTLPSSTPSVQIEAEVMPQVSLPMQSEGSAPSVVTKPTPQLPAAVTETNALSWEDILWVLYIAGAASVCAGFLFLNIELSIRLHRSRKAMQRTGSLMTYHSDAVETPCLFGPLRPAIYVTSEAASAPHAFHHSVSHEQTHYRHGDHIWSILRGLCLALHWYNPLVWVAAIVSGRDAELACDEATLHRLGEAERASYARTLISLSGKKRTALSLAATTMSGGKHSLKERVARIVKRPKMAVYTPVVLLLVCAIAVGCTFSDAKSEPTKDAPVTESTELITEPVSQRTPSPSFEYNEPTIPPEDLVLPYYVLMPFFTDNPTMDMAITYRESSQVQYNTYEVPEDIAGELYSLFSGHNWEPLEERPQIPDVPALLLSREASYGLVILNHGNTGILEYHTADGSYYWARQEQEGLISVSEFDYVTRRKYDGAELRQIQFLTPFAFDGDAEGALQMLAESVYPQPYMELTPGHYDRMNEYKVLDIQIHERREDGKAITGYFYYAFAPDSPYRCAVGGEEKGTGEYEGMILWGDYVCLELWDDGLWHWTLDQAPLSLP